MGSGLNFSAQGKYVGNGGSSPIEIKPGFKPKVVKIRSAAGEVVMHETMPGAWKQTDAAVPSFLAAAALSLEEFGFKVTGSDAALNAASADYYYEMYA